MQVIFLMIAAGIFKAIQDTILFHFTISILPKHDFFNQNMSWKFKYKNGDFTQGERFFGSTTFLVFLTDGFHLAQFFFLNTMILAIVLYEPLINWWADFLIYGAVMKGTFQLNYGYLLIKKEQK